ncbi:class II fructose-bisphosphatase [Halobacillus karajensis]|uniref:Fructose-1,6-bisphosphatase n=1 Tax=Halobacillus karajensis TaxID=195088 RepID=A0A024P1A8_9BACI|nr:class II fructose-bisphosphatase [Halobacillus karajensis]CDQ19380.1 Fructose-1,6-bisphosphatase class 2 [Halobacillus karajensis]CDQ21843.1 Fructose-1,6-bisphosphatase class 2 [Halobacillus karajensis]CDQ27683.1 Fructose-1,6-bisphosphatase class 2 [Halobacillus karajensis]
MQPLLLDFLKVTEFAAIAALPWVGSGDKIAADDAATTAMRNGLNEMSMNGRIVIGEGEIDEAPMLYIGENLGSGKGPEVDIAVDPIEGTTPTVNGQSNAITVIAAAPKGKLLHAPDMYMKKIAVGSKAKGKIDIEAPLAANLKAVAEANDKNVQELNVLIQDRPRHQEFIDITRSEGAKVHLFNDGDVIYATATCLENLDIDMFLGIGGAPEGVLGAVALKCLGGEMQGQLMPRSDEEIRRCIDMGLDDPRRALSHSDLVNTEDCIFAATGITDNLFLKGVRTSEGHHVTHSILINGKEKQLRYVESQYPEIQVV